MTFYTSYWEQARFDDWFFAVWFQCTLGKEFVTWANARRWCG